MTVTKYILKVPVITPEAALPDRFFRAFNTWIPDAKEIFVDIADYQHVHDGPLTLLVGHYTDYVLDAANGELGLAMRKKRPYLNPQDNTLEKGFDDLHAACERLKSDPLFLGKLVFGNTYTFCLNDRLPLTKKQTAELKTQLKRLMKKKYPQHRLIEKPQSQGERLTFLMIPN